MTIRCGTCDLIVVSNRLPITVSKDDSGEYHFKSSSGGVASCLSAFQKSHNFIWIGSPGIPVPPEKRPFVDGYLETQSCQAVYLDEPIDNGFYNGFSNSVIWPLFHHNPGMMKFDDGAWLSYLGVNVLFARAILRKVHAGTVIWVQDYHFMVLPLFLRGILSIENWKTCDSVEFRRLLNEDNDKSLIVPSSPVTSLKVKIGFFLHTVFPNSDIFNMLPVRKELLLCLLCCDLLGFHTFTYMERFLTSCDKILGGALVHPHGVEVNGNFTRIGRFHIGIDTNLFLDTVDCSSVRCRVSDFDAEWKGAKIILGVDRLDYIKGLPLKLQAFELFLSQHPEWEGKIILAQVAVPSRECVKDYISLSEELDILVSRINKRFRSGCFRPIHYFRKSIDFDVLCAMYSAADIFLVTSTQDGLNLVCYEYVACQKQRKGVVILSEFAGAADNLYDGSIVVNPWDLQQVADAINDALKMDVNKRAANHEKLFKFVSENSAASWGKSFLDDLASTNAGGWGDYASPRDTWNMIKGRSAVKRCLSEPIERIRSQSPVLKRCLTERVERKKLRSPVRVICLPEMVPERPRSGDNYFAAAVGFFIFSLSAIAYCLALIYLYIRCQKPDRLPW